MKKGINTGFIILIIILFIITAFLAYIVISKQNVKKSNFNIKVGDILTFEDYDTKITILNIASTLCENCLVSGEIEVSLKVEYNEEITNYTLKSETKKLVKIKNSNNYIILNYDNNKILIDIKDRKEINN